MTVNRNPKSNNHDGVVTIAVIAVLLAIIAIVALVYGGMWVYNTGRDAGIASVPTPLPTTAPTPTPAPQTTASVSTVIVPQTAPVTQIEFVVSSTTMSNGYYEVITTNNQILAIPGYDVWNTLEPQGTYTAQVTGYSNGIYYVDNVVQLIPPPPENVVYYSNGYWPSYPHYYYNNGAYYKDDGVHVQTVTYKDVSAHRVYNGVPPHRG